MRIGAVGICATDLEVYHGTLSYFTSGQARYPIIPGHEWAGEIVGLGEGVRGFWSVIMSRASAAWGCPCLRICLEGRHQPLPDRTETGILNRDGAFG